ncbi:MAG: hypothetical protein FJY76_03860 [Candidatus Aenigmarchaeota archaeon]|nr:hypothetical protein [Candidatus Aenigmarchaeota archaeon]
MRVFGRTLKDYLWSVKWYVLLCVLVVIFQYDCMLLLMGYDPLVARITQWLWMLFVAAALVTLVRRYGFESFGVKNILFSGVLFAVIIHGLKAFVFRVFFFPYAVTAEQQPFVLLYKFFYGSGIVMAVAAAVAMYYYLSRRERQKG